MKDPVLNNVDRVILSYSFAKDSDHVLNVRASHRTKNLLSDLYLKKDTFRRAGVKLLNIYFMICFDITGSAYLIRASAPANGRATIYTVSPDPEKLPLYLRTAIHIHTIDVVGEFLKRNTQATTDEWDVIYYVTFDGADSYQIERIKAILKMSFPGFPTENAPVCMRNGCRNLAVISAEGIVTTDPDPPAAVTDYMVCSQHIPTIRIRDMNLIDPKFVFVEPHVIGSIPVVNYIYLMLEIKFVYWRPNDSETPETVMVFNSGELNQNFHPQAEIIRNLNYFHSTLFRPRFDVNIWMELARLFDVRLYDYAAFCMFPAPLMSNIMGFIQSLCEWCLKIAHTSEEGHTGKFYTINRQRRENPFSAPVVEM